MKFLIVCETAHEVESLWPVANELSRQSQSQVISTFASLDRFYFQKVSPLLTKLEALYFEIDPRERLVTPIPYKELKEIVVVWRNQSSIAHLVRDFDAVLCGFDGMVQRILIAEANEQKKPTFQVINAMQFHPLPVKDLRTLVLLEVRKLIKLVMLNFFKCRFIRVPGDVGFGGCDLIFVMGQNVKDVLVAKGIEGERIVVSGLPRLSHIFRSDYVKDSLRTRSARLHFDILFMTSAYLWHHDHSGHDRQQTQLREVLRVVQRLGDKYRLLIKMHPREDETFYQWICESDKIKILHKDVDLYNAISRASIVLTEISSGIFEAIALQRLVVVLKFPLIKQSIKSVLNPAENEQILTVDTPDALMNLILQVSKDDSNYHGLLGRQIGRLDYYIDPKTPYAAEVIAREILRFLSNTRPYQKGN